MIKPQVPASTSDKMIDKRQAGKAKERENLWKNSPESVEKSRAF